VGQARRGELRAEGAHTAGCRQNLSLGASRFLATGPESASAPGSSGVPIQEIAAPREESLVAVAKLLVARRGEPVRIEGVSGFYGPDRELYESGALLPGPDATLAGPTFEEWLDSTS
jgi:hypothetical protein